MESSGSPSPFPPPGGALASQILDQLPVGVALFDGDGRFRFVGPHGFPAAAVRALVPGHTHHEWARARGLPRGLADGRQAALEACLASGERQVLDELVPEPLGGRRWDRRTYVPFRPDGGLPTGVLEVTVRLGPADGAGHGAGGGAGDAETRRAEARLARAREARQAAEEGERAARERLAALAALTVRDAGAVGATAPVTAHSPAMAAALTAVATLASAPGPVVLRGEPGSGRARLARALHRQSERDRAPFVAVDCADEPAGTDAGPAGDPWSVRLDLARGGTLFLDEVAALPPAAQRGLVRALESGAARGLETERGGVDRSEDGPTDREETPGGAATPIRVVASTGRDLAAAAEDGSLDPALLAVLNGFTVDVPPLRRRPEDLPELAGHFLAVAARRVGRPVRSLTDADLAPLLAYAWPGNVAELRTVMERAVAAAAGERPRISLARAPGTAGKPGAAAAGGPGRTGRTGSHPTRDRMPHPDHTVGAPSVSGDRLGTERPGEDGDDVLTEEQVQALVQANTARALARCGGRIHGPDGAAALLGVRPTTLASRVRKWGLGGKGGAGQVG